MVICFRQTQPMDIPNWESQEKNAKLPSRHDLCHGSSVINSGSTVVTMISVLIMVVVTLSSDECD